MFNKPGVFGRNEPVARREAVPVLGTKPALTAAERNAVAAAAGVNNATLAASNVPTPPVAAAAVPAPPTGADAAFADQAGAARLIVGPEVKLKGAEILDCDTLVVEGRVEATMDSRLLRIAEKGSFVGTVSIDVAEIHGRFEGELTARSQLIIHSTGRVSGTIRFGKLVVAEGGELNGEISVISGPSALKVKPVAEPYVALSAAAG